MGKIICSYEGFGMPVLFTTKGMIYLQRESRLRTYEQIRREEKRRKRKGEKESEGVFEDKVITMEWVNANSGMEWQFLDPSPVKHSYGTSPRPAKAYGRMMVKNLYPGIDIEFSFVPSRSKGFEYQLFVHPGADPQLVQMKFAGDVSVLKKDLEGNLIIKSALGSIEHSSPVAFTERIDPGQKLTSAFRVDKQTVSFRFPKGYDKSKLIVIDPFVTATSALTGVNAEKAKDIDFDYAGNIYVGGAGSSSVQLLAKYNPSGVLLWTFSGTLPAVGWVFGPSYGGWVVEKTSGAVYLGQGLTGGWRVIRLDANGNYDNYITTANNNFTENWKMIYGCRQGISTILAAGGGGNANNELALLSPPSLVPGVSNISGLTGGHNDISDIVLDPLTDDMYTIFSTSVSNPAGDNIIYKHTPPHNAGSRAWSVPTGLFALHEPGNRPYLSSLDNSSNVLALNSTYLFYWDGQNLKAFDKTNGNAVGAVMTVTGWTKLAQGGIYADECNNVFVGGANGLIKAYKFTGTVFDDAAIPDLPVTGFNGAVYDLAYDNGKKLLYASGNGFVASIDMAANCPAQVYDVQVTAACVNATITATVVPAPSTGTTITYVLYSGSTQLASNSTGQFTGFGPGPYTITAFLNQACGGLSASHDFVVSDGPAIVTNNPAPVCVPNTVDLTNPAITAGSPAGLTYTYWLDAAATIPYNTPATATANTYYIKGSTGNGCFSVKPVIVGIKPSPVGNAGPDQIVCSKANAQLQASGGVSYQWSPALYLDNPATANPVVVQAPPGVRKYWVHVTDIDGCKSQVADTVLVTIQVPPKLFLPSDTTIVINQPLQLNPVDVFGLGMNNFVWTPSFGLNDANIRDPIAIIDRNISYTVTAQTTGNCSASARINVTVYQQPDIFVPTGFTPNNNGLNDVLKAKPVGLKSFLYFRVYNRYGSIVFSTSDPYKGWDGKINGVAQNSGVFVWMAEGVDYTGKSLFRKGTTVIIR
jgi:gliding motility-associated-like protein